jgi:peptidoglycan/xylan/chitin deacetylase (PgdA/CDA1 family)
VSRAVVLMALAAGALGASHAATGAASRALEPAARRPVAILMYHRVGGPAPAGRRRRLWVSRALFGRQLAALERAGYRAVTLDRVWRAWHGGGGLPARPVVLSFDDGYGGQYRHAAPALRRHGWPGVLNLELRRLGVAGGLGRAQVRRLIAAGWEVDAHSLTHPDLTRVGAVRLQREVAGSRAALRRAFDVPANFFAYPYGRFDATVQAAVRAAGFVAATTIRPGVATPGGDPYALRRIQVGPRTSPPALVRRLRCPAGRCGPLSARRGGM